MSFTTLQTLLALTKQETCCNLSTRKSLEALQLEKTWQVWFDRLREKGMPKVQFRKEITRGCLGSFSTLQGLFDILLQPKLGLTLNSNIRIFKKGHLPTWEDPANKAGGKFHIIFNTDPLQNSSHLSTDIVHNFLRLVLRIVFSKFGHVDQLCGCVLSVRKNGVLITVWNTNAKDESHIADMAEQLREHFKITDPINLKYYTHKQMIRRNFLNLKARRQNHGKSSKVFQSKNAQEVNRGIQSRKREELEAVPIDSVEVEYTGPVSEEEVQNGPPTLMKESDRVESVEESVQLESVEESVQLESIGESVQLESVEESVQLESVGESVQFEVEESVRLEPMEEPVRLDSVEESLQLESMEGSDRFSSQRLTDLERPSEMVADTGYFVDFKWMNYARVGVLVLCVLAVTAVGVYSF